MTNLNIFIIFHFFLHFFTINAYGQKTQLVVHRGITSKKTPENTLYSLKEAWKKGLTIVELDIQRSKDGKLFVFHDDEIEGTFFSDMTQKNLEKYNLPSLTDFLNNIAHRPIRKLFIEIKGNNPLSAIDTWKIIKKFVYKNRSISFDQIVIISFSKKIIKTFQICTQKIQNRPKTLWLISKNGWLEKPSNSILNKNQIKKAISIAKKIKADGIDFEASSDKLGIVFAKSMIQSLNQEGLISATWTSQTEDSLEHGLKIKKMGPDFLTTEYAPQIERHSSCGKNN